MYIIFVYMYIVFVYMYIYKRCDIWMPVELENLKNPEGMFHPHRGFDKK